MQSCYDWSNKNGWLPSNKVCDGLRKYAPLWLLGIQGKGSDAVEGASCFFSSHCCVGPAIRVISFSASMILSLSLVDFCWRFLNWVLFLTTWVALLCLWPALIDSCLGWNQPVSFVVNIRLHEVAVVHLKQESAAFRDVIYIRLPQFIYLFHYFT